MADGAILNFQEIGHINKVWRPDGHPLDRPGGRLESVATIPTGRDLIVGGGFQVPVEVGVLLGAARG